MHTIRLRHPWASEVVSPGRLNCVRKFHRPTGLAGESVTLIVECIAPWTCTAVRLNGNSLASTTCDTVQIDVTHQLEPFNTLACQFALASEEAAAEATSFEQLASAQLLIQEE